MLLVEKPRPGIAVVTFNRPEAMNALSRALRNALRQAIQALDADAEVKVIVLTGAGERAFTAGLDLKELGIEGLHAANATEPEENPARAVLACSKPIIGAINGVAITGGFEVALACDVLICSINARFADTHARVGITPGWGLSQKLSRAIGPYRAKELSLTGNFLSAQQAYDWGLVNRVVEPADLMTAALDLAQDHGLDRSRHAGDLQGDDRRRLRPGAGPGARAGARALARPQRRGHAASGRGAPSGGAGPGPHPIARPFEPARAAPTGRAPCKTPAARRDRRRKFKRSGSAQSSLGVRTWRPRYMPVFRSMWCGRFSSPVSLSST